MTKTKDISPNEIFIEWTYEPKDFFSEEVEIKEDNYQVQIRDGRITVSFDPDSFDKSKEFSEGIKDRLKARFHAKGIVERKSFNISDRHSTKRKYPDGRGDVTNVVAHFKITASVSTVGDVVGTDSNGEIIHDTKAIRIEKEDRLRN